MGHAQSPFPISGDGACELDDRCLTVTGFRPARAGVRALVITGGLFAGLFLAVGLSSAGASQQVSVGAAIAVFIAASVTPLPANKRREARFRIPWNRIRRARVQHDLLLVSVKGFTPQGEIHFATTQPKQLLDELDRRIRLPQ